MTSYAVNVPSPEGRRSYPVIIAPGALARLPEALERARPSSIHVVSDARVWRALGRQLAAAVAKARAPVRVTVVPSGERSKSPAVLARLWRDLIKAGCDRRTCLVAFGGGMVGDLTGFAAASVLRGIDFVQVPTTLLAMVDAAIGGKTGINLPEGKNLVGAFHQPRAVVMDLALLRTLPRRELRAGWAEVIKTAAIRDLRLFRSIEADRPALLRLDLDRVARVVAAASRIKARVVELDERESDLRMLLNFGHTLAHALETVQGYRALLHGEAVSIGMAFAARLGEALGASRAGTAARLEALLSAYGLPVRPPRVRGRAPGLEPLVRVMGRDKKRGPRGLRWVLLKALGSAEVRDDVPAEIVRRELGRFCLTQP